MCGDVPSARCGGRPRRPSCVVPPHSPDRSRPSRVRDLSEANPTLYRQTDSGPREHPLPSRSILLPPGDGLADPDGYPSALLMLPGL
jgi:hypothetical protein